MGISDWSSDVCSSDLPGAEIALHLGARQLAEAGLQRPRQEFRHATAALGRNHALAEDRVEHSRDGIRRQAIVVVAAQLGEQLLPAITFVVHQLLADIRSEEHTSELQSLMRISYAVFCLKKKKTKKQTTE